MKKKNYKGHECFAYKDVIIDNKEYTVIIKDIKIEAFDTCSYNNSNIFKTIISVEYLCSMFDNEDNLIYSKSIYKSKSTYKRRNNQYHLNIVKEYLNVVKEFCSDYFIEQERIKKDLQEENLALQELEEWDGIINK